MPDFYRGYRQMPLMFDYSENSRALGLADMCTALRSGRDHRANYQQQRHVLEIMTSFSKACAAGKTLELTTRYERTAAMQPNVLHGVLED